MNQFLQRMLRKSEEEENSGRMGYFERSKSRKAMLSRRNINRTSYESPNRSSMLSRKSSFSKPAWMKKLGNSFEQPTKPIKVQTPKSSVQPTSPKLLNIPTPENTPSRMASFRKAKTLPASLNEKPNLEHIVQEFESGFMSPRSGFEPGSGSFVKKIVAAFEEKYKSYNDSWSDRVRGKLKDSGLHRHSYSNICQSLSFTTVEISKSTDTLSTETVSSQFSSTEALKTEYGKTQAPKLQQTTQNQKEDNFSEVEYQNSPSSESKQDSTLKKDRTPIIIGAFLKKPVKVEETSINWIPFPGTKLPRKKSLKKLLSVLSGKKFMEKKKEVVFASQINVSKETRELPDSGYDEQSLSSSSLTSITSTPEVVPQERTYANISSTVNWSSNVPSFNKRSSNLPSINRRSTNLSTFQAPGEDAIDDESDTLSTNSKKLFLYEVPREEVKVDLGPCYPAPSRIMVKSLDRRVTQRTKINLPPLPKHPLSARIPKHPFISLSKDELNESSDVDDEIELRRSKDKFSSFHSSISDYDVPRRFLSRSEPGISDVLKFTFDVCLDETNNYDVPKLRAKSSVYEDALSLKRRNADFGNTSGSSQEYYSSPSENEPQFATIRSRNRRYLSPEVVISTDELRSNCLKVTSF